MSAVRDFNDLFRYDALGGCLLWRTNKPGRGCIEGREAGTVRADGRYRTVFTSGRRLYVHRIIWEMHNGPIPADMCIDHINGNGLDNRLTNLRLVSRSLNQRNRRRSKNNRTGITGVYHHGDAFVAHAAGEYLGRFPTVDAASTARRAAEQRLNYLNRKE